MLYSVADHPQNTIYTLYRVMAINMSRKWIEWAEWAASLCTANSPFPGHVYCRHPVEVSFLISANCWSAFQIYFAYYPVRLIVTIVLMILPDIR